MSTLLPTVLWYGALIGAALAVLLVLWALALYAFKHATGPFVWVLLGSALALAVASSWAMTRSTSLSQHNQLIKVHALLLRLVAGSIHGRSALELVRVAAQPSPELTAFQSTYQTYEASIESLLQAEWLFHRRGAWDERALLHHTTWGLNDLQVHHARWERRAEALECSATTATPALPDAVARLRTRLQTQQVLAQSLGEQFDGHDLTERNSRPVGTATVTTTLAMVFGGLALLSVAAAALVWRRRPRHPVDVLVALGAIVLVNLAGWLALGTGADQERVRADLFGRVATAYREVVSLNAILETLKPTPREGVLQPGDSPERIIADYALYMNSVRDLARLVRIWDRAVLTDTFDPGIAWSERVRTHDDLLNEVRTGLLTVYRQYVQLDGRITERGCRSEWFPKIDGRSLEDELLALP